MSAFLITFCLDHYNAVLYDVSVTCDTFVKSRSNPLSIEGFPDHDEPSFSDASWPSFGVGKRAEDALNALQDDRPIRAGKSNQALDSIKV
jgi:hypothetical protein